MGGSGAPERGSPLNCRLLLRCRLLALRGHIGHTEPCPLLADFVAELGDYTRSTRRLNCTPSRIILDGKIGDFVDSHELFGWLRR